MAVITDSPPASSLAVKPDVITMYYREPDVRETEAKPTPVLPVVQAPLSTSLRRPAP